MTTIIARSAESVHWYKQDGGPQYTVPAKDGSERPTTLRDARKMNLVPSVTTILKIAAKPGLELWKMEQMLLAALTLPKRPEEPEKDYITRIVADSKETGKQAAEKGTRIHESIEQWFGGKRDVEHKDTALAVNGSLFEHFKTHPCQDWLVERSFADPMGFGGKVDLFCKADQYAPTGIVADIKSKDFGPDDKVDAYDEHLMQLAAYRYGLNIPHARCANVFVSRTHPGLVKIIEWAEGDLTKGWEMFKCLLNYWRLKHSFQRIYKVTGNGAEHLVQATSQAQALRHVAGKQYAVDVAKAIDVTQLMSKGIKIEVATGPTTKQLKIKS